MNILIYVISAKYIYSALFVSSCLLNMVRVCNMYILLESKRLQVQIILFNPQKKSLHMLVKKLSFGKTIKVNKFHTFLFMGWQVLGKLYFFEKGLIN